MNTTPTISETLRRLLFNKKMKITDLSRATKVPQPTLQRIAAGDCLRPHKNSLQPIADYFNISVQQLMGEEPISWLNDGADQLKELGIRRVPLLAWENVMDWLEKNSVASEYQQVLTDSPVSEKAFSLALKDSSMEPIFSMGTQVIFDPTKPYRDRHFVLVKLAQCEEPVFRQLIIDASDMFIKPLNPDLGHFRIHMLNSEDNILGVLVEAKQQYGD